MHASFALQPAFLSSDGEVARSTHAAVAQSWPGHVLEHAGPSASRTVHVSATMLSDRDFAARTDDLGTSPGKELLVASRYPTHPLPR